MGPGFPHGTTPWAESLRGSGRQRFHALGRQRRWRTIIVAWVNAAVRSDIASSARTVGSSRSGQPRHVKTVHAGGVAAGDLGLFVVWHALQDLRQDLPRLGKRRLAVRIVRAPHHVVDADDVAQANTDGVLLEAQDDIAAEEVAGLHTALESVECLAVTLAVCVIH